MELQDKVFTDEAGQSYTMKDLKDLRKFNGRPKSKAGRKEKVHEEKKSPINVYLQNKKIDILGGVESARKMSLAYLESEVKKRSKK